MKKKWFVLLLLYVFQFAASCSEEGGNDDFCDCGDISSIEITFTDINSQALEITGDRYNDTQSITESIFKEDLLLQLDLVFNENVIALNSQKSKGFSFGFDSATACSCVYPTTVLNPIETIQVLMASSDEEDFSEANGAFGVVNFFSGEGFFTIEEALEASRQAEENLSFISRYRMQVLDESVVPEQAKFKVLVTFMDETVLEQETPLITFK